MAMPNRLLERERFEIRRLNAEIRVARIEYMIAVLASGKCFFPGIGRIHVLVVAFSAFVACSQVRKMEPI